jgi:putative chitinase
VELLAKQLATAMPTLRASRVWLPMLNEAIERFEIESPACIVTFLAQIAHESNECRSLEEDLRYTAETLVQMWPRHFPTLAEAQAYERNPEKLGNYVYANRMGNGPPESCDGYRYRGRGLIRIVGRANYASAGAALGVDLERQPESLLEPRNAALSAAWLWKKFGLNERRGNREIVGFRPALAAIECLKAADASTPLFGAAIGDRVPAREQ